MATYALVKDNLVFNTIEWDGEAAFDPGEGVEVHPIDALPPGVTFPEPVVAAEPSIDEVKAQIAALLARLG